MTIPLWRAAAVALVCLSLASCMGLRRGPQPVIAAPSQPVQRAELPPPQQPEPPAPIADEALPGEGEAEVQVAAATVPTGGVAVGRTDLLGGWAISSGGETCQLFMSLTQWTGGYRASTRGCNSPTLAGISAWDLADNTVTLKSGEGGGTVATLAATEQTRFNGATSEGAAITVSR